MFSTILLAEKHAENGRNDHLRANVASAKALCYNRYHQFKEAEKNYKVAIEFAQKIENADFRHRTLSKIYSDYSNNLDAMGAGKNEVILYGTKAIEEDLQLAIPDYHSLSASYTNLGTSYIAIKDYKTAEIYFQKALFYEEKMKDKVLTAKTKGMLAEIELKSKNYQKAIGMYEEGLAFKNDPDLLEQSYVGLAIAYDSLKNAEKANLYYGKYAKLKDSLADVEKSRLKIPLDHIEQENESIINKHIAFFVYVLVVGVSVIFILWIFFFYKINKIRKEIKMITAKKDSEIIENKKQLNTKINDSFSEILLLAKTNDPSFLSRFQEVYPEFCSNIKSILPDITQNELHFCGFLKLKLSTKDIAEYQFVTPKAIQNRKNKLRKRLNLDPKIDLYDYLEEFN